MIPLSKPSFDPSDLAALAEPLEKAWVGQGPKVRQFEEMLASYAGVAQAVAVSNGTVAISLLLQASGIGRGDEVILPAFTFAATAHAVVAIGATPVLADIDLSTFNISANSVRKVLSKKSRAVLAVHQFGLCADLQALSDVCSSHRLQLFEDAACALGARWQGQHPGSSTVGATLSFHPRKVITTGEGGIILTQDSALADKLRLMRNQGMSPSLTLDRLGIPLPDIVTQTGNSRMSDLAAALGISQCRRLSSFLARRAALAERYHAGLSGTPELRLPAAPPQAIHSWQSYVVLLDPEQKSAMDSPTRDLHTQRRNRIIASLAADGIDVKPGTHAINDLAAYAKLPSLAIEPCSKAMQAARLSLSLPIYPDLSNTDQDLVIASLAKHARQQQS